MYDSIQYSYRSKTVSGLWDAWRFVQGGDKGYTESDSLWTYISDYHKCSKPYSLVFDVNIESIMEMFMSENKELEKIINLENLMRAG